MRILREARLSVDLDKARANLPLPALLERLGHGDAAKKSARCPFHDDKAASFSVSQMSSGRWWWTCYAGCGKGDEADFIAKLEGIDNATALKRYGELAGANGSNGVKWTRIGDPVSDALKIFGGTVVKPEPAKLEPLTAKVAARLADWRKYSPGFVKEISDAGIIGLYEPNKREGKLIAFPVTGGVHYRKADGSWRYTEGAKASLMALSIVVPDRDVHCLESPWDALAYADITKERNVIATRGASNIAPLAELLAGHKGVIYLWAQNDPAGQKWAESIREALPDASVRLCVVPKEFKDLNDLLRAKGKSCELEVDMAIAKAEDFPVATGTAPAAQVGGGEPILSGGVEIPQTPGALNSQLPRPLSDSGTDKHSESCDSPAQTLSSLGDILDAIVAFLRRYMAFSIEEQSDAVALWIANTYVYNQWQYVPYLHIFSPEKRCGKSVLLGCIKLLAARPNKFSNTSNSALFRYIDQNKPTILWDEVDNIFVDKKANAELIGMLNDGYEQGAKVIRCRDMGRGIDEFDVFCPKALTGIGELPDTTHDRCIDIHLVRQNDRSNLGKFRVVLAKPEAEVIRAKLESWGRSANDMASEKIEFVKSTEPRVEDITEPLLAVAQRAGPEWSQRGRDAMLALFVEHEDQSTGAALLSCIRDIYLTKGKEEMTSSDLVAALIAVEQANAPWVGWWEADIKRGQPHGPQQKLARMLGRFGIKPKRMLGDDFDDNIRGYLRADFVDAWSKYLKQPKEMVTLEMPF